MTFYKTTAVMKDGSHKVGRVSKQQMAHIIYQFQKFNESIFNDVVTLTVNSFEYCLNDIKEISFKNLYTGEVELTYPQAHV